MRIRTFLVVVCLLSSALVSAQQAEPEPPPAPQFPEIVIETAPPSPAAAPASAEQESEAARRDRLTAQSQALRPGNVATNLSLGTGDPDLTATLGTSTSGSSFTIFSSSSLPLLKVRGDGRVGIGTSTPQEFMEVVRNGTGGTFLRVTNSDTTAGVDSYSGFQLAEGTTKRAQIASLNSGSNTTPNGLQIWNYANGPMMFATNGAERARIHADGTMIVGSTSQPGARFAALESRDAAIALQAASTPTVDANTTQHDTVANFQSIPVIASGVLNSGGNTALALRAAVQSTGTNTYTRGLYVESGVQPGHAGAVTSAYGIQVGFLTGTGGTVSNAYGLYISDVPSSNAWGVYQVNTGDQNFFAGQVRIGSTNLAVTRSDVKLHVTGGAHFTGTVSGGNIQATYQDVAEWVPATTDLTPGTVVVLNGARNNEVMASSTPYDTMVAGVVSEQPGLSLGIPGEGKEQIATTGRVKVRVDARTAPIRVGDLLVTSPIAGTAMKSEPMDINGRKFHQPGTIIGKALEPLESGVGEILVLLSMQ